MKKQEWGSIPLTINNERISVTAGTTIKEAAVWNIIIMAPRRNYAGDWLAWFPKTACRSIRMMPPR